MPEITSRAVLEIRPAKDSLVTYENFVHVLASLRNTLKTSLLLRLFGKLDTITLEMASLNQTIYFVVTCPEKIAPLVKAQIAAQYPDAIITHMNDYMEPWLTHGAQTLTQLSLAGSYYLPLNTIAGKTPGRQSYSLGVLGKLPANQGGIIQFCLSAAPGGWANYARALAHEGIQTAPEKKEAHPQKALIEGKIALPGFNVDIRVAGVAPDQAQADLIVIQIATSFGVYSLAEGNSLKSRKRNPRSISLPAPSTKTGWLFSASRTEKIAVVTSIFLANPVPESLPSSPIWRSRTSGIEPASPLSTLMVTSPTFFLTSSPATASTTWPTSIRAPKILLSI